MGYTLDKTDCDDADNRAKPGQMAYFATPRIGKGGYDFNCDMSETRDVALACVTTYVLGCNQEPILGKPGYTMAVPACGMTGSFCVCAWDDIDDKVCANTSYAPLTCTNSICAPNHSDYGAACSTVRMSCR